MAAKAVNQTPVYEEFEPFCKWQRKEDQDILEIHLQEFKKEQLKVQISNHGILKISGERPVDASTHTKFYKEVSVPSNNYDATAIHAKFVAGTLIITLPKLKTSHQKPAPSEPPKINQTGPATAAPYAGGGPKEQTPAPQGNALAFEGRKRPTMGRKVAKVAVSLAATAAAVAILIAYVVYMSKSTVPEIDDEYGLMN